MSLLAMNDIALVWGGWLVAMLLNLLWGHWAVRLLTKESLPFFSFRAFWVGWVVMLALLQGWHFFLPITPLTIAVGLGAGLVVNGRQLVGWWQTRPALTLHPIGVVFLLLLFLVADFALRPIVFFDNGLYHLQTIRWATTYPIVTGLGNLYGPLAYNQLYFLWLALFDVPAIGLRGFTVGNGLLMVVLTWEALLALITICTTRRFAPADVLSTVLLIPLINLTFVSFYHYPATPNPDYATMLISFKLTIALVQFLTAATPPLKDAVLLLALATALPLVKLSGAVYGAGVLLITVWVMWRQGTARAALLKTIGALVLLVGIPWVIGNIILSGYLVYPSSLAVPVAWQVAPAQALDDLNLPRSFSRRPELGVHWSEVLDNWDWLPAWWVGLWEPQGMRPAIYLLSASWVAVAALALLRRRLPPALPALSIVGGIAVAELFYWFLSAPAPRFGISYFWILAALGAAALWQSLPWLHGWAGRLLASNGVVLAGVAGLLWFSLVSHGPLYGDDFAPVPVVPLTSAPVPQGGTVFIPDTSQQGRCWDAPLPCTPYLNPRLRLRDATTIGGGFLVQP